MLDARDWLNRAELVAHIKAADLQSPDLARISELVHVLAAKLNSDVELKEVRTGNLHWSRGKDWGDLSVQDGRYWLTERAGNDFIDHYFDSTEKVVWTLCGRLTPDEERANELRIVERRAKRESLKSSSSGSEVPKEDWRPDAAKREKIRSGTARLSRLFHRLFG